MSSVFFILRANDLIDQMELEQMAIEQMEIEQMS